MYFKIRLTCELKKMIRGLITMMSDMRRRNIRENGSQNRGENIGLNKK